MFVAVVMTSDGVSHRSDAGFAGFVNDDKDLAIEAAMAAIETWAARAAHRGYYVAVGELTERTKMKRDYEIVPIIDMKAIGD